MNMKKKENENSNVVPIPVLLANLEKAQGAIAFLKFQSDPDFPEVRYLKIGDLTVDPKWQRWLNKDVIQKAKHLDPELFQCIVVFERPDGDLVIVDGQHKAVMALKAAGENIEVPCQVIVHDKNMTLKQCQKKEAKTFELLNFNRKNVNKLAKIRAGLAYGDDDAKKFEAKFITMGIFKEGIGDVDLGIEIDAPSKAENAFDRFDGMNCKRAVEYLRTDKKGKPLNSIPGSMVFGMAAIFNLLSALDESSSKHLGLSNYLNRYLKNTSYKKWARNCAGNLDYVIIARRIVDASNLSLANGHYDGSVIGEKVLESNYLGAIESR